MIRKSYRIEPWIFSRFATLNTISSSGRCAGTANPVVLQKPAPSSEMCRWVKKIRLSGATFSPMSFCCACVGTYVTQSAIEIWKKWCGIGDWEWIIRRSIVGWLAICSGSPMLGVWLANITRFWLEFSDNETAFGLTISDNRLAFTDNGSPT